MYADRETAAMKLAIGETNRRRIIQEAYNVEHGITPTTVIKAIMDFSPTSGNRDYYAIPKGPAKGATARGETVDLVDQIEAVRQEMFAAAENLEFEKAARLRDHAVRSELNAKAPRRRGAKRRRRELELPLRFLRLCVPRALALNSVFPAGFRWPACLHASAPRLPVPGLPA